jgi:predicted lipoprotein with Yx(FWY)xxD motif
MMSTVLRYVLIAVVCIGAAGFTVKRVLTPKAQEHPPWHIESAVPPGFTLIEPDRDALNARVGAPNPALGDAEGRKLYTLDADRTPGKSACTGTCSESWTPFAASADAKAFGDWSVVVREDGFRQWAYRGSPLYLPKNDVEPTHPAEEQDPGNQSGAAPPAAATSAPKTEGHIALFKPEDSVALPLGISIRNVPGADGYGLVDREGLTLYTFEGDARDDQQACLGESCGNHWKPLFASELIHGVGDFSLVSRSDGRRQWAYKGKPLYTFDGDLVPGTAMGKVLDKRWQVALLLDYFVPSNVRLETGYHGLTLSTSDGQTLYTRNPFVFQAGGFDNYAGLLRPYSRGKLLGTEGCDEECLKTWHPLVAPANAVPSGFWEIATRANGTRQWMYKGYALYTYTGDKNPGDVNGNDTFDLVQNDDGPYTVAIAGHGREGQAAALYWHIAMP